MKELRYYMIFLVCGALLPDANARQIIVAQATAVTTLTNAIALARNGDTIRIMPGIYRESAIHINRQVVILGEQFPVIDGEKKQEILIVEHNNVIIEGLVVRNGGYSSYNDIAAIRILNADGVKIRNNRLENTFFGIYSQHGTNAEICGNQIRSNARDEQNSANGIHCWKSDRMFIHDNEVTGHRDGIYFEFVTNSVIRNNHCYGNVRYGLHFMFSNDDRYENNRFNENGAGVAVMYSHHVTMLNNQFLDNWGDAAYGLLLKEIADGELSGNLFQRNSIGVYMESSNRLKIHHNRFTGNGWALKMQASCEANTITANNFQSNSFDVATNGSLVLNTYDGNYWDKYEGYDLNRDGTGDVPFRPVSVYSYIIERNPSALMLFRSLLVGLLDRSEKVMPGITPEALKDEKPLMKPLPLISRS